MLKPDDGGLTVSTKLVLAPNLPGSVAVSTTVEVPLTLGVPEILIPLRLNPTGKPDALSTRLLGVSVSVNTLATFSV